MTTMPTGVFGLAMLNDPKIMIADLPPGRSPFAIHDRNGESLVQFCLYRGRGAHLDALLALGFPVPLHEAAALGRIADVEAALARGPEAINLLSADGWTPLHLAAFFGHAEIAGLLLSKGADASLYSRAFECNLPLHAACAGRSEKTAVVELLIPATPDIDARQGGGWTPLMLAAGNGMTDTVTKLLNAGADPSLLSESGKTARDVAREAGQEAVAALFERAAA